MAAVEVTCLCGRQLTLDTALVGTTFRCPTCARSIAVPGDCIPASNAIRTERTLAALARATPAPKRRKRTPLWLLVAAGGLVAIALVILVALGVQRYYQHRADDIAKQQAELPKKKQERQAELERKVKNERTQLTIIGPAALQAGAPNIYSLEVKSLAGSEVSAKFSVRLLNKAGQELANEKAEVSGGRFKFNVPL